MLSQRSVRRFRFAERHPNSSAFRPVRQQSEQRGNVFFSGFTPSWRDRPQFDGQDTSGCFHRRVVSARGGSPRHAPTISTFLDRARGGSQQTRNMTLSEMRHLLATEDLRLTRSLGQNFLHDGNQLRRIVALAEVQPGDDVLEIGPGLGPLTEALLQAGARVLAIEKDHRLIPLLQRRLGTQPGFELIHADALEWLASHPRDWSNGKLVANLPYSVGSPILVDLAQSPLPPRALVATLQAEVVDRIRARPATPEYGLLTVLLAEAYQPGSHFRIPASCFFPAPDVASACIRLDRRPAPLVPPERAASFRQLVKRAFSQRRKQLRTVLRGHWPDETLAQAWQSLGFTADVRAETLSPEIFAQLLGALEPRP